ncbi:hypothetical protein FNAPI_1933 [Fusarium napiforme]|uniref:Apple domain-containing protein n=1 Tax=Fusarium napiforme TaxID=42672 RepID=A0A8H5JZL5_9HYPO|nr:hypothetical protein FNAPI_1933 [Fusarium napiforme]
MRPQATLCALWASLIPLCLGIDIYPTTQGGLALASILFGNSKDIFSSSSGYTGDPSAIRSFTNGPFGMGSGVIISTGSLTSSPLTPGGICPSTNPTDLYDAYTHSYCGPDSYNGANYLLNVQSIKATTFVIDMVIASCDVVSADKVLLLVNGVNVAKDETGTALDSSSKYLSEPWGIPSPNGDTAFAWTSPPLRFSITVPKFTYTELKMAVCDMHDGYGDTALMIKIRPCNDCDVSFKVDYDTTSVVSTTTYETTSVVTQAASGTVRGTISYITYVTASATSTTAVSSEASTTSEGLATSTSPVTSTSAPTTTSAPSVPKSCGDITNPYQGPSNSQFEVTCNSYSTGGNQIGNTHLVTGIAPCIDLCAATSGCKAAMVDRSQSWCYLLDGSDGPAANNLYDMATLLSSESSTTSSPTTTTSAVSGPTACNQLDNPTYIDGVQFTIFCGKQATGGNEVDYSAQLHSLTECMEFCVDNLACRAVTFDTAFSECYLYDGFNGFMSDLNKDLGIVASRPAAASTTEAPTEQSTTTTALATSTEASASMASETSASIESTSESTVSTIYTTLSAPVSSGSQETMSLSTSALTSETSSEISSEISSAGTSESQSYTTTLAGTSDAVTSLPTTSSPPTSFSSFSSSQDASSGTTSDSALQSTTESESASTASATSSGAAISLSTELSASGSTDATSLSTESVSESTSDTQLVSTSAEESASLDPTTTATTEGSLHTDTASIVMSTTETLSTKTPLEETSTAESETSAITNSVTVIESTVTRSSLSDTSRVSTEIQSTSEGSALPSTSAAPSASNIPALGEYTFTGCLKSMEGYPSFKEVATDPHMTTRKCVDLALGSEYIGVYQETCYKADVLDDAEFIADARCDLPCPGDHTLFCGGILRSGRKLHRRAIAPNHLLTLYRKKLSSSSDVSSASSSAPPSSSSSSSQATGTHAYQTTSETSGISHSSQTGPSYSLSSSTTRGLGSRTISVSESTTTEAASETRLPTSLPTPTAIHTAYSTMTVNHAYTKTQFAETVTTVTYTTVNPSNPASLITTCVPITLLYSPCGCKDQVYPTVDMTTVSCTHGGDVVTLTVPKAAYETGSASYTHPIVQYPTGWVGGHQTDAGSSSHPAVKPTGGSQPGSKNGQPEVPTTATGIQGSYPSYKTHQAVNPTSAAGSYGGDQPEHGKPQPSIPAQGSAESNNNSPENPSQPESPTSLTTETSIMPSSQHGTSGLTSESSPLDQGQVPSESNGAPYATSVVVSEAHKSDLATWITMTAIVGMVLFL